MNHDRTLREGIANIGDTIEAPQLDNDYIIREWIDNTTDTIKALQRWRWILLRWAVHTPTVTPEEFRLALSELAGIMGDGWADRNPSGGGLDALREAVTGQEA